MHFRVLGSLVTGDEEVGGWLACHWWRGGWPLVAGALVTGDEEVASCEIVQQSKDFGRVPL